MIKSFPEFPLANYNDTHYHLSMINEIGRDESLDETGNWVDEMSIISKDNQAAVLYELAANLHALPYQYRGYCLELGTWEGGSAAIIAGALKNDPYLASPMFTVDISYQSKTRERWDKMEIRDRICQVIYDDFSFLHFWHLPTRLILIDGDHEYDSVKRLILPAMKCLAEGGWCVFHDYEPGWDGVVRAVNEFLDSQELYELEIFLTESLLCIRKVKALT